MKKPLFVMVMVFGVLAIAGARTASAQNDVTARVPFPFVVDGHQMPAGNYRLETDTLSHILLIVNQEGRSAAFSSYEGTGLDAGSAATFQFKKVGGEYMLWRVSTPSIDVVELPLKAAAAPKFAKAGTDKGHKGND